MDVDFIFHLFPRQHYTAHGTFLPLCCYANCVIACYPVKLLMRVPASLLSISAASKLDSRTSKAEDGQLPQPQTVSAQAVIQSRSKKLIPAVKVTFC